MGHCADYLAAASAAEWSIEMPNNIFKNMMFCQHCDYAIGMIEFETIIDPMIPCPRCGVCPIYLFYGYGSTIHKQRRHQYENGLITGNPVPIPSKCGMEY